MAHNELVDSSSMNILLSIDDFTSIESLDNVLNKLDNELMLADIVSSELEIALDIVYSTHYLFVASDDIVGSPTLTIVLPYAFIWSDETIYKVLGSNLLDNGPNKRLL